jgi:endonuclease/exonuclease/phosphatase family metal-dependent hydrolase
VGRERWIAEVIRQADPDCVVLQEAVRPDVVARLADLTGLPAMAAERGRSLAVLARDPFGEPHWIRPRWSQHAFIEIALPDRQLDLVGVHLSAVHAAWTEARRVHELRSLLAVITARAERRHVVLGDFNTLAPGEALDAARLPRRLRVLVWLSGGRIRWQTIAIMLGAGYVDCYRHRSEADAGSTFPSWDPHVRLDYAFVPRAMISAVHRCVVIRDGPVTRASDHFPLLVELSVDPAADESAAAQLGETE